MVAPSIPLSNQIYTRFCKIHALKGYIPVTPLTKLGVKHRHKVAV